MGARACPREEVGRAGLAGEKQGNTAQNQSDDQQGLGSGGHFESSLLVSNVLVEPIIG